MTTLRPGSTAVTHVLTDDGLPTTVSIVDIYENVALVSVEPGIDPYEVPLDYLY